MLRLAVFYFTLLQLHTEVVSEKNAKRNLQPVEGSGWANVSPYLTDDWITGPRHRPHGLNGTSPYKNHIFQNSTNRSGLMPRKKVPPLRKHSSSHRHDRFLGSTNQKIVENWHGYQNGHQDPFLERQSELYPRKPNHHLKHKHECVSKDELLQLFEKLPDLVANLPVVVDVLTYVQHINSIVQVLPCISDMITMLHKATLPESDLNSSGHNMHGCAPGVVQQWPTWGHTGQDIDSNKYGGDSLSQGGHRPTWQELDSNKYGGDSLSQGGHRPTWQELDSNKYGGDSLFQGGNGPTGQDLDSNKYDGGSPAQGMGYGPTGQYIDSTKYGTDPLFQGGHRLTGQDIDSGIYNVDSQLQGGHELAGQNVHSNKYGGDSLFQGGHGPTGRELNSNKYGIDSLFQGGNGPTGQDLDSNKYGSGTLRQGKKYGSTGQDIYSNKYGGDSLSRGGHGPTGHYIDSKKHGTDLPFQGGQGLTGHDIDTNKYGIDSMSQDKGLGQTWHGIGSNQYDIGSLSPDVGHGPTGHHVDSNVYRVDSDFQGGHGPTGHDMESNELHSLYKGVGYGPTGQNTDSNKYSTGSLSQGVGHGLTGQGVESNTYDVHSLSQGDGYGPIGQSPMVQGTNKYGVNSNLQGINFGSVGPSKDFNKYDGYGSNKHSGDLPFPGVGHGMGQGTGSIIHGDNSNLQGTAYGLIGPSIGSNKYGMGGGSMGGADWILYGERQGSLNQKLRKTMGHYIEHGSMDQNIEHGVNSTMQGTEQAKGDIYEATEHDSLNPDMEDHENSTQDKDFDKFDILPTPQGGDESKGQETKSNNGGFESKPQETKPGAVDQDVKSKETAESPPEHVGNNSIAHSMEPHKDDNDHPIEESDSGHQDTEHSGYYVVTQNKQDRGVIESIDSMNQTTPANEVSSPSQHDELPNGHNSQSLDQPLSSQEDSSETTTDSAKHDIAVDLISDSSQRDELSNGQNSHLKNQPLSSQEDSSETSTDSAKHDIAVNLISNSSQRDELSNGQNSHLKDQPLSLQNHSSETTEVPIDKGIEENKSNRSTASPSDEDVSPDRGMKVYIKFMSGLVPHKQGLNNGSAEPMYEIPASGLFHHGTADPHHTSKPLNQDINVSH